MKKSIVSVALLLGIAFSCKDSFLETAPYGSTNEAVLSSNEKGADALLIAAYSNLDGFSGWENGTPWGSAASDWTFGSIAGGDAYKGSEANDQPISRPSNATRPMRTTRISKPTGGLISTVSPVATRPSMHGLRSRRKVL